MQAVTLITNSSGYWICSQFSTHSDESIQMMGLPTPSIFSNAFPPNWVMRLLEGKATKTPIDWQIILVEVVVIEDPCVQQYLKGPGAAPYHKMELHNCNQGIMIGDYLKCHSYWDVTMMSILNTHWWPIPDNMVYYCLCRNQARKALPPGWQGICTIGTVVLKIDVIDKSEFPTRHLQSFIIRHKWNLNPLVDRSSGFHKFVRGLLQWLRVSELEKTLVNISRVIKQIENWKNDAISTLQQEMTSLSKVVNQNGMALNLILASKGGHQHQLLCICGPDFENSNWFGRNYKEH